MPPRASMETGTARGTAGNAAGAFALPRPAFGSQAIPRTGVAPTGFPGTISTPVLGRHGVTLLSLSLMLVFMTASMSLSSLATVTPDIQRQFAVSDSEIGMLTSIFMGFFAVSGLLSGLFACRWGGRLLALTCGCFLIGSAILGLSSSLGGFAAGRAIQGIGGGMVVSVCNPLVTRVVPGARVQHCLGVFGCGWGLGHLVALLVLPTVAAAGGFRAVFLSIAGVAFVVGCVTLSQRCVRVTPRSGQRTAGVRSMAEALAAVVRTPRLLLLGLTACAQLAISVGILVWTPTFLEVHRGASPAMAAYLTAGIGASQVLGNLSGAAAAERWGRHRVIIGCLAVMTTAAALVAIAPGKAAAAIMVLVAGFCSYALFPPMISYISQVVAKPEHIGAATGVHTVIGFAGSLVAPWVFGLMLQSGTRSSTSFLSGYLVLAAFGVAATVGMGLFRPNRLEARRD